MLWNSIKIPFAIQDSIVAPARSVATFYVHVNHKEVETGLVLHFHLGEGIYAGDAVANNRDDKAYIRMINTRHTDAKIVIPRVDLERLEKIKTSGPNIDLKDHNISNMSFTLSRAIALQSTECVLYKNYYASSYDHLKMRRRRSKSC